MAKQIRQLRESDIDNLFKQEFIAKKVILTTNTNKEFKIEIQEKLNESSIMELVTDLVDRAEYCQKNNKDFNSVMNTYFLLIKYFTNINFKSFESIGEQYLYEIKKMQMLTDTGLFDQIVGHFNKETMNKIQESFKTYAKQMNMITNNQITELLKRETNAEVVISNEEEI